MEITIEKTSTENSTKRGVLAERLCMHTNTTDTTHLGFILVLVVCTLVEMMDFTNNLK